MSDGSLENVKREFVLDPDSLLRTASSTIQLMPQLGDDVPTGDCAFTGVGFE